MTRVAGLDWRAVAMAVTLEVVLLVLAAFGGPHGVLGGWPWILQLPGFLVFAVIPGPPLVAWRAAAVFVIQSSLWYSVIRLILARRTARAQRSAGRAVHPDG